MGMGRDNRPKGLSWGRGKYEYSCLFATNANRRKMDSVKIPFSTEKMFLLHKTKNRQFVNNDE